MIYLVAYSKFLSPLIFNSLVLVVSAIQSHKIIIGWYCVVTILCLYVVGSQWTRKYRRVKGVRKKTECFELLKNIMFIYATVKH